MRFNDQLSLAFLMRLMVNIALYIKMELTIELLKIDQRSLKMLKI